MTAADIVLRNDVLDVRVRPSKGADIASIRHLPTGAELLWRAPWPESGVAPAVGRQGSVAAWLERCGGGWQIVLPNGGDECEADGVSHGFHGEAALLPWTVASADDRRVALHLNLLTLPLHVERSLELESDLLTIGTVVRNDGPVPVRVMWTEHPGFGGMLLDGPSRLATGARTVIADDRFDVPHNLLAPGSRGAWPNGVGPDGAPVDLREVRPGRSCLAYLTDNAAGRAALTRTDGSIGVLVSWDASTHPYAWLWQELGATRDAPWFGRAMVVGIEPATSWPGQGLARVAETTRTHLVIEPGEQISGLVRLHVFTGLTDVDAMADGRAIGPRAVPRGTE